MEALAVGELLNLAQESSGGWAGFWGTLWSGEWLANVGLPLGVAFLAIWMGYRGIRRQLEADRVLIQEARQREFAADFAASARRSANEMMAAAMTAAEQNRVGDHEMDTNLRGAIFAVTGAIRRVSKWVADTKGTERAAALVREIDVRWMVLLPEVHRLSRTRDGNYLGQAVQAIAAGDSLRLTFLADTFNQWPGGSSPLFDDEWDPEAASDADLCGAEWRSGVVRDLVERIDRIEEAERAIAPLRVGQDES